MSSPWFSYQYRLQSFFWVSFGHQEVQNVEYETRRVSLSLINVSDYHHQMAEHPVSRKNMSWWRYIPQVPGKKLRGLYRVQFVECVYKPWLLFGKCFPYERLGPFVYEIQYPLIHIHLQAMACNRGWLKYESGLSNDLHFQTFPKISLAQTKAARLLVVDLRY